MSLLRPFSASDLFEFNPINLDAFTGAYETHPCPPSARSLLSPETYGVSYYLSYLSNWGDLFS